MLIYLFISLFLYLSIYLSIYLSTHLSIHLLVTSPTICPSMYSSDHQSICQSIYFLLSRDNAWYKEQIGTLWRKKQRYLWAKQKHRKVRCHMYFTGESGKTCFPESLQKHGFWKKWFSSIQITGSPESLKILMVFWKKCIESIDFSYGKWTIHGPTARAWNFNEIVNIKYVQLLGETIVLWETWSPWWPQAHDHSTCMYYGHSTCMYFDHSTCMYVDLSACVYFYHSTCNVRWP